MNQRRTNWPRRIRRTSVAALSLLTLITAASWARSVWWQDGVNILIDQSKTPTTRPDGEVRWSISTTTISIATRAGQLYLGKNTSTLVGFRESDLPRFERDLGPIAHSQPNHTPTVYAGARADLNLRSIPGITLTRAGGASITGRSLFIAHWLLLLVFAAYPTLHFIKWTRGRRRPPHTCTACGYDQRGSPTPTCPECGSVSQPTT